MDGSSAGRPIGPPGAACWFAAWSPDGKWTYVSSGAGGGVFHIWRQRFSANENTPLEQITSGPTGEEGIAMAPDGRSFITAVGLEQGSVWVHDSRGERRISLEGDASDPTFSPDAKTLYYLVRKNDAHELWFADLTSGRTEPLLPGFSIEGILSRNYDLSPDGKQVVMNARDGEGKPQLWLARVDRRSPPRPIPNVEGDGPLFGPGGEVFFRAREGSYGYVYTVRQDGTGLRKVSDYPVISTGAIAPDGRSVVVYARHARAGEEPTGAAVILPLAGGAPIRLSGGGEEASARWSARHEFLYLPGSSTMSGATDQGTLVVPLSANQLFPKIPEGGFAADSDLARLPGARLIDASEIAPGPSPDVYAFSRRTVQRNLYRIPVP
jgi:Tol biopolymer transport system component